MKTKGHVNYEFFTRVDDSTNLGKFFNIVFDKLDILRIVSAPSSYESLKKIAEQKDELNTFNAINFYELCLGELYLHSIINNLNRWQELLKEYNGEFQSSWRYYALSKRMDSIKEYGGEEKDYNDDGSIKTIVSDDELVHYSIINRLVPDDWKDIFLQTEPSDLIQFAKNIIINEKIDVIDMVQQCFGKKLTSYRIEDDKMVENTFADELINRIEREDSALLTANTLMSVCVEVSAVIDCIRKLDRRSNNEEFFALLPRSIQNLFDMKIKPAGFFEEDINN